MIFLNPSILLGLLAASIPLIIHLLNFRKLNKVEFSSLNFLKELQKSKIRKIKIKQWLLLFLRILLIILLVLAFARPTLEGTNIIGASSAKSSSVFVLDNSPSMSYVADQGSYFNQSKKIIKEIINNIDDGNDFYFITTSDSIKNTKNKTNALNILDDLQITQLTKPLSKVINNAKTELLNSQNINKEIFIFSDFQKSTFLKSEKRSFNSSIDENIKSFSFDMSEDDPINTSVSNLKLNNSIIEINKPLSFSVNVSNFSNTQSNDQTVSLFLNDRRVAQQTIALGPFQTKNIDFETTINSTGLIEAKAEIEDDNILQDNLCYLNFEVLEKINILLIYNEVNDINFLESAINTAVNSGQFELTEKPISTLSYIDLNNYNMVFIVTSGNIEFQNIKKYLSTGGNIVIFPNSNPDLAKMNELYKEINLPVIQKIISVDNKNANFAEFESIDFSHPLFQNLFSEKKQQIESPNIYKYLKLESTQNVKNIIKLNDKSIFLGETNFNKGRIIFFNTAPNLEGGNFPLKSIFAPLITRTVLYLTKNQNENNISVGENIKLPVTDFNFPILEIIAPNKKEKINLQNNDSELLNFYETENAGSYKFYNNKDLVDFASVNLNPIESDLRKMDLDSLKGFYENLFDQNYTLINKNEKYIDKIRTARYGTELWKLFLLLAFLTALIEMFVARSSKKDLMNLN